MKEQTEEIRHIKQLLGLILGSGAICGFILSLMAMGGPNAHSLTANPTGWWGVLPYGVIVSGAAAYLLIRDTL